MFDPSLVQNNLNYQYGGSTPIYIFIALRGVIMFAWPFLIKSSGSATATKEKDKSYIESPLHLHLAMKNIRVGNIIY